MVLFLKYWILCSEFAVNLKCNFRLEFPLCNITDVDDAYVCMYELMYVWLKKLSTPASGIEFVLKNSFTMKPHGKG